MKYINYDGIHINLGRVNAFCGYKNTEDSHDLYWAIKFQFPADDEDIEIRFENEAAMVKALIKIENYLNKDFLDI